MFNNYFQSLEKKLIKKYKTTVKKTVKKKAVKKKVAKKVSKVKYFEELVAAINDITPAEILVTNNKIVDQSSYVSDSADFIACKNVYTDLAGIFAEGVPTEIVYAAYHVCPVVNRKNFVEVLKKVAGTKKSDQYVEKEEDNVFIPSFIISFNSTYTLEELKKSILEIYTEENIEPQFEFDIMVVLGEGIIIKDWRDKRAYIALETKEDTLKWFFVLMNEYIEVDNARDLDLRSYIKETRRYNEY